MKCKFEELGEVVPGCLEIEHEWSLRVSARGANRVAVLRAVRRMPGFASMPLSAVARALEAESFIVGPFSRGAVIEAQAQLEAAGLTTELIAE